MSDALDQTPSDAYTDVAMDPLNAVPTVVARATVRALLALTEAALCTVCGTDDRAREEIRGFPDGFTFEMRVLPSGPGLRVRKDGEGFRPDRGAERPTLSIQFKHLRHALRVMATIDDVPSAIARDRLVIDGELAWAMRFQRISDRMMGALIPRSPSWAAASARLYVGMISAEPS